MLHIPATMPVNKVNVVGCTGGLLNGLPHGGELPACVALKARLERRISRHAEAS